MEVAVGDIRVNTTGTKRTTITMRLVGNIDQAATKHLRTALVDVILHRKPNRLIIDLNSVIALDAAAVGVLRAAQSTAQDTGLTAIFRTSRSPLVHQLDRDGIYHDSMMSTEWSLSVVPRRERPVG
jgi:anti-anti-sigma factor